MQSNKYADENGIRIVHQQPGPSQQQPGQQRQSNKHAEENAMEREIVNQQPGLFLQHLSPEELEQYKGVQKWAQVRRERRIALGLNPDDEPRAVEKDRKAKTTQEGEDRDESWKCWTCLTCCCLCGNCCS